MSVTAIAFKLPFPQRVSDDVDITLNCTMRDLSLGLVVPYNWTREVCAMEGVVAHTQPPSHLSCTAPPPRAPTFPILTCVDRPRALFVEDMVL